MTLSDGPSDIVRRGKTHNMEAIAEMNVKVDVLRDLDALGSESVTALRKFLSQTEHTTLDIGKARVAASALSAWTRAKQTESAREGNFLLLARELANDKTEFRKFVKIGMPNAPILTALPSAGKS